MLFIFRYLRFWALSEFLLDTFVQAYPQHQDSINQEPPQLPSAEVANLEQPATIPQQVGSPLSKRYDPNTITPSFEYHRGQLNDIPSNDKYTGTPDLSDMQRFWLPARVDGGMDIWFAHDNLKGALGDDIRIIDIGIAWQRVHKDLPPIKVLGFTKDRDRPSYLRGTHVAGVLVARQNDLGLTGIVPNATFIASSLYTDARRELMDSKGALLAALKEARPGDVILSTIEVTLEYDNRHPKVPRDFEPEQYAIIRAASEQGFIVVLSAGDDYRSGGFSLDDDAYVTKPPIFQHMERSNPWKLGNPWSGAIIVGSGASPGTNDLSAVLGTRPFSRAGNSSNFGTRIDVQARGENVSTTTASFSRAFGYRHTYNSGSDNCFTDQFGDTAAAAAIIAGVIASIQGIVKADGLQPLNADDFRALFRNPTLGLAQVYHPEDEGWIGIQPDMRKLIPQAIYRARAKRDGTLKDAKRFFGDGINPHLRVNCSKALREHLEERAEECCTPNSGFAEDDEPIAAEGIF